MQWHFAFLAVGTALLTPVIVGCGDESISAPGRDASTPHRDGSVSYPDGGPGPNPPLDDEGAAPRTGHVLYQLAEDKHFYWVEARDGAEPEDISAKLDALSAGRDKDASISHDGDWIVMRTTRFGCDAEGCLVLLPRSLSRGTQVTTPSGPIRAAGTVGPGGNAIVFVTRGTHDEDLFITQRTGSGWTTPQEITTASSKSRNSQPAFSRDGTRVAFSCGNSTYQGKGTEICEVLADGTGFRVVVDLSAGPRVSEDSGLRSPDYAPDGSLVFEGEWTGEQVWRISSDGSALNTVNAKYSNDNSPCVLPDGSVASLWLERDGNSEDAHELKIMGADGQNVSVILPGVNVFDVGLSCSD